KNIEAETELIDEVVHIAFIAAVIVAEKTQPLSTADQHPAREVDGADAPQASGLDDVTRCIVDHQKNASDGHEPQQARFQGTQCTVRIRDIMIFRLRQDLEMVVVIDDVGLRIGLLQAAKLKEVEEGHQNQQRRNEQQQQGYADQGQYF